MDFGVSNPTAWYAAALSPEGEVIVYDEYYSPGLISTHASRILTFRNNYWGEPIIAICDPTIKNRTGFGTSGRGETVHSEFNANGIYLVPANNDRIAGRVRISELLRPDPSRIFPEWHPNAGSLGSPRLFIASNCTNLIEQLRHAPIDPVEGETVDPYWESRNGHSIAALRYLVTARVVPPEVYQEPVEGMRRFKEWRPWGEGTPWREV
jgi:hypothetical protein